MSYFVQTVYARPPDLKIVVRGLDSSPKSIDKLFTKSIMNLTASLYSKRRREQSVRQHHMHSRPFVPDAQTLSPGKAPP